MNSVNLIETLDVFVSILTAHATGRAADDEEYKTLRQELTIQPLLKPILPRFVFSCRNLEQFWGYIQPASPTYQGRRVLIREAFAPAYEKLEQLSFSPSDKEISSILEKFDVSYVHQIWNKALERRDLDPEAAITSARTLLESVCKHILDDLAVDYSNVSDLPKLYRLTAEQLKLAPDQHTEDLFKRILGGCQSVVEGLGAIRNRLSDAHGQGRNPLKPASRHAELAVNLAGSMALFLVRTWEFRRTSNL